MTTRVKRNRPGLAAVELAVTLPFLIFVIVVGVDFCRIFYKTQVTNGAVRGGALYAYDPTTMDQSPYYNRTTSTGVTNAAQADATDLTPLPGVTYTTGTTSDGNNSATVGVSQTFNMIVDWPGVPSSMTTNRTITMRVARNLPLPP